MAAKMGQAKGKVGKSKVGQGEAHGKLANQRAREATADLIDHRLRKALSHEMRVQILSVANQREISPSQFSKEFDVPLSNVSYHFRKLVEFDCLELVCEVPVRGSHEHRYVGSRRGLIVVPHNVVHPGLLEGWGCDPPRSRRTPDEDPR